MKKIIISSLVIALIFLGLTFFYPSKKNYQTKLTKSPISSTLNQNNDGKTRMIIRIKVR